VEQTGIHRAELTVSDPSQLRSLEHLLGLAGPSVRVLRAPGSPGPSEQGAVDVLVVLASSSGVVAAIKVLPEFLRSRKASLSITMTVKGKPFSITAANVDEVMPILERLLDD
jgi:hypothetical protein